MNNNGTIKRFQLRAGRSVLGIGVREIGECLGLSGAAISLWEHKDIEENLKTTDDNIILLRKFFEQREVFFSDERTISLNPTLVNQSTGDVLTRFQLRAGRAILNLSQSELADYLGVSTQLITRAERLNNKDFIRPKEQGVVLKIKSWFESNGIYFTNNLSLSYIKISKK
jgi:transcriptional regulator with XRE-family HTH domain